MLPLVDKPVIQYAVEEAVAAGIEQVIIVTSSQKRAIEDHFDHSYELEHLLEAKGDIEMLRRVRQIGDMVQISYVRQKEQLGLGPRRADGQGAGRPRAVRGHPVGRRRRRRAPLHRPADRGLPADPRVGRRGDAGARTRRRAATASSTRSGRGTTATSACTSSAASSRSPSRAIAPSDLAIIGRYVLTPKIFEKLEQTPRGAGGEIQLTDAIEALMAEQDVYAYAFEGTRHDAGTTMGWLKASVELALERDGHRRRVPALPGRRSTCADARPMPRA